MLDDSLAPDVGTSVDCSTGCAAFDSIHACLSSTTESTPLVQELHTYNLLETSHDFMRNNNSGPRQSTPD